MVGPTDLMVQNWMQVRVDPGGKIGSSWIEGDGDVTCSSAFFVSDSGFFLLPVDWSIPLVEYTNRMRLLIGASISLCWRREVNWSLHTGHLKILPDIMTVGGQMQRPVLLDLSTLVMFFFVDCLRFWRLTFFSYLQPSAPLFTVTKRSHASGGSSTDDQSASKKARQSCDDLSGNIQLPNHTGGKENCALTEKQAENGTSFTASDL